MDLTIIRENDVFLNTLLALEDFFDSCDLYAYRNWELGSVYQGPYITRYWVSWALKYQAKHMPNPAGLRRLNKMGCFVRMIKANQKVLFQKDPDDLFSDKPNTNAIEERSVDYWILYCKVPRRYVEHVIDGDLDEWEEEIDIDDISDARDEGMELDNAYESIINNKTLLEGLRINDLKNTVLPNISVGKYKPKLNSENIVVSFYCSSQEPANDLFKFLGRSENEFLDCDYSTSPNDKGLYCVYLEYTKENVDKHIDDLLISVCDLCGLKKTEWKIQHHKSNKLTEWLEEHNIQLQNGFYQNSYKPLTFDKLEHLMDLYDLNSSPTHLNESKSYKSYDFEHIGDYYLLISKISDNSLILKKSI